MKKLIIVLFLIFLFIQCSSSEEQVKETKEPEEVYVFDDVSVADTTTTPEITEVVIPKPEPVDSSIYYNYIVQLGAFSTNERALRYIEQNKDKISQVMEVVFDPETKLYNVQLPIFYNKIDAERVKSSLVLIDEFKDTFIKKILK